VNPPASPVPTQRSRAFPDSFPGARAGSIDVRLRGIATEPWLLTLRDDGMGFPTPETGRPESLGTQLIHAQSTQIEGCVQVDPSHGTTVNPTFSGRSYTSRV
jgi:two-component sensor histidine kinase